MTLPTSSEIRTIIFEAIFGSMYFSRMRHEELPIAREASMNSSLRNRIASPRATRAKRVHIMHDKAIIRLSWLLPSIAATAKAKMIVGKARKTSTTRIVTVSNFPPMKPETIPMIVPASALKSTTKHAVTRDILAPSITLHKIQRPKLSVPKGYSKQGTINCLLMSI